jgi:hypothetical protein
MWKLTEYGKTRTGLPGVPWRDLTAHEFAEAKRRHPGIEERGYFERDEPKPEPKADDATAGPSEIIGGRPPRTRKGG